MISDLAWPLGYHYIFTRLLAFLFYLSCFHGAQIRRILSLITIQAITDQQTSTAPSSQGCCNRAGCCHRVATVICCVMYGFNDLCMHVAQSRIKMFV